MKNQISISDMHEKYEYVTKNRKLKLEEYDDNGNLIGEFVFEKRAIWEMYRIMAYSWDDFMFARKAEREHFQGDQLELAKDILLANGIYNEFDSETVKWLDDKFRKYSIEKLRLAIALTQVTRFGNLPYLGNCFVPLKYNNIFGAMDFNKAILFIESVNGIYLAIDNNCENSTLYVEPPTKRQAKYQRMKNGRRIIFLNFKDFKKYSVSENELE